MLTLHCMHDLLEQQDKLDLDHVVITLPQVVRMGFRSPRYHRRATTVPGASLWPQSNPVLLWSHCPHHLHLTSAQPSFSQEQTRPTSHRLLDMIKHQIHQLIVPLQCAHNCLVSVKKKARISDRHPTHLPDHH